jgi:hypothetical protein
MKYEGDHVKINVYSRDPRKQCTLVECTENLARRLYIGLLQIKYSDWFTGS